jgi:hypothetical protein
MLQNQCREEKRMGILQTHVRSCNYVFMQGTLHDEHLHGLNFILKQGCAHCIGL